jgi:hypothetical protein
MSNRATDKYLDALDRKPVARASDAVSKQNYKLHKKRQIALSNLTGGGFLVPKPHILKEGLEELREVGHKRADIVEKINRKRRG